MNKNMLQPILKPSVLVLTAANIALLAAAFLFNWDTLNIVLIYVSETFIIGVMNIFKMAKSQGQHVYEGKKVNQGCIKLFSIPFFIFHYNFFIAVQLILTFVIFESFGQSSLFSPELSFVNLLWKTHFFTALTLILFSHGFSYYYNYIGKKEYLKYNVTTLMFLPYKRIVFQQLFVIFGAILLVIFQMPAIMLIFYVLLKTLFDVFSHLKTHNLKDNHPE